MAYGEGEASTAGVLPTGAAANFAERLEMPAES